MKRKNKTVFAAIAVFMSTLSCVMPTPVFVPVKESDIDGLIFIPLFAAYGGQSPAKLCADF